MRNIRTALAIVLLVCASFAARAADDSCGKNHYILGIPECVRIFGFEEPIGPPGGIAVDAQGNVFFSTPHMIMKLDVWGKLARVAGGLTPGFAGDGGPASEALLDIPLYWYRELQRDSLDYEELLGTLATDAAGNLYVADAYNNRIRKIDASGVISTIAGTGSRFGVINDGQHAVDTALWWPQGIAVDPSGNVFISDAVTLYAIGRDNSIKALALESCGSPALTGVCYPQGVAVDGSGRVYVADALCRIQRYDGRMSPFAGGASRDIVLMCGHDGDGGPAAAAKLNGPFGVAVDRAGNVFIADTYNNCIRKVDIAQVITTVAGRCGQLQPSFSGDGGPATAATLSRPHAVAVDATGTLYIADTDNMRIRMVRPDGIIFTIAGNGQPLIPR